MRTLTIEARSRESAAVLYEALEQFSPRLVDLAYGDERCLVEVGLGQTHRDAIAVLNAIESHLNERGEESARVEFDGRSHLLEATRVRHRGRAGPPAA
jgi:hypothetical protein